MSETSASAQLINDVTPSYALRQQPTDNHLSAVDDAEVVTAGSADDDEAEVRGKTSTVGVGTQPAPRPFPFCVAVSGRAGITANGGLSYHQLPAAC